MAKTPPIDYQKLQTELEAILAELETGELDVDKAVKQYQRGQEIVKLLETYLKTAENTIKKVKANG